ncbi:unnamed protein product [Caenorhabditis sp. 36 PRJEB53466]|nr:unnamed protein product [Caenorhabditis sp. 36 PRJEB53466]
MGTSLKDNSENQVNGAIELANGFRIVDYKVVKFIAKGAFGAVYQVDHINTLSFALKIENRKADVKNLKMEAVVLKDLAPLRSSNFCRVYFSGRAETFNFIIMTLVGKNLNELRANCAHQKFSKSTGLQTAIQVVSVVQKLHSIGYIHRDVKPANFCVSLEDARQLVMVDFGMCRKYVSNGQLRHPRWFVRGFKGTVRYASLAAHHGRETSRKDDLESAFYLIVELLVGTLPWMTMEDPIHAEHAKQIARTTNLREFLSGCPKELIHVLMYIDSLNFYDAPDYALIRGLLNRALEKAPKESAFEWEEEMKNERKSRETLRSKEEVELEDG